MENTKGTGSSAEQAMAFQYEGIAYYKKGFYDKAIDSFTKALNLRKDAVTYSKLADAHYMKQDLKSAIDDYSEAIELDRKVAEYYIGRGNMYTFKQEYQMAINDYDKAIELAPGNADYYAQRAASYFFKGDKLQAILDFTQAIELDPKAEYYANRGNIYSITNKPDFAIADLTHAVELDPGKQEYQEGLDTVYRMAGSQKAPNLEQSDAQPDSGKAGKQINYWDEVNQIQNRLKWELRISTIEAIKIAARITGKLGYFFTIDCVYHSEKREDILRSLEEAGKNSEQWVAIEALKKHYSEQEEEYVIADELTEDELIQSASTLEQVISQLEKEVKEYLIKQGRTEAGVYDRQRP